MTSIVVGKDRISLVESERYVAGTKNLYIIKVAFSEDWEGIEKKLVFKTDCFEQAVELVSCSEQFPIPYEVLARPSNKLQIGAYGYKCNELVLNTRWLSLGRVTRGTVDSSCGCCSPSMPIKPTPDTYEVLKLLIERKADRLTLEDGSVILWAGDDPLSSFELPVPEFPDDAFPSASLKVPIGTILIWSGTLDDIPESYALCDGQNGTVDLRDAFVIGASDENLPGENGVIQISPMARNISASPTKYYALAFIQKIALTDDDMTAGKSAYEIAVYNGFEGTEEEWLESLKGSDGKSAYDIAVKGGFKGTETEFANALNLSTDINIISKTINSVDKLPTTSGSYILKNVSFKSIFAGGDKITFSKDIVYIDRSNPDEIVLTTLNNKRYICKLNSDGSIIEIFRDIETENNGNAGKSAYDIALENGFEGTEKEWLESLKGADGKSAYDIAIKGGFEGTEGEWLESLKGVDGKSAYDIAVEGGFKGSVSDWLESIGGSSGSGSNGKSAYDIALENGFEGTEKEWLESLKGADGNPGLPGDNGLSAYELAVISGFTGTEEEWLQSLKGQNGSSAYEIAIKNGFEGTEEEWLESLTGESGKIIQDFSKDDQVIGRWKDKKPIYRVSFSTTISAIDKISTIANLTNIDAIVSVHGSISNSDFDELYSVPGSYNSQAYGISYSKVTGDLKFWASEAFGDERRLYLVIEYTKIGDSIIEDDALVTTPGSSETPSTGTNDHTKLLNRSADNQHPISSIGGLTAVLSNTPTKSITDEELDALFD